MWKINLKTLIKVNLFTLIYIILLLFVLFGEAEGAAPSATPQDNERIDTILYDLPIEKELQTHIYLLSKQYNMSCELILSVAAVETGETFKYRLVSGTQDYGLMQLNKPSGTLDWLATIVENDFDIDKFNWKNPYHNVSAGVWYLDYLRSQWKGNGYSQQDIFALTLLSYNMGLGAAHDYINYKSPYEWPYVKKVARFKNKLESGEIKMINKFSIGNEVKVIECDDTPKLEGRIGEIIDYEDVGMNKVLYEVNFADESIPNHWFGDDQIKMIDDNEILVDSEGKYEKMGRELGEFTDLKERAYGSSVDKAYKLMQVFLGKYENEDGTYTIPKSLLKHILLQVRMIDKQNRIFSNPDGDLMDESPYQDLAGYSLIGVKHTGA